MLDLVSKSDPFFASLPERSFMLLLLESWTPTILTVVVGAYLARVIFPKIQQSNEEFRAKSERKRNLAEEVAVNFDRYISEWRRLIQITSHLAAEQMNEDERARMNLFVKDRKEARDSLMSALSRCQLYFSETTSAKIAVFIEWEEGFTAKETGLPGVNEWRERQREILGLLVKELHFRQ